LARSNRGMATQAQLVISESQQLMARFIQNELDLGMTFCESAAGSTDILKINRSLQIGRRVSKAARHFLPYLNTESVSPQVIQNIEERIAQLEKILNSAAGKALR
jgi:hypothetical protein